MPENILISGPAGAGKSQRAQQLRLDSVAEGEPAIVVDFQSILAALLQLQRGENGRYPPRTEEEAYALRIAERMRARAITVAIEDDVRVIATNSDGSEERRNFLLGLLSAGATDPAVEEVLDPGRDQVVARLSIDGELTQQCSEAISRWYDRVGEQREAVLELREVGQTFRGVIIQEGRAATGSKRELFAPGSVEWPPEGIRILPRHLGETLATAVPVREPNGIISVTTAATDSLRRLVREGKDKMSVEFYALAKKVTPTGVTEFQRALVDAVTLTDIPEYSMTSAEVRERRQEIPWWV